MNGETFFLEYLHNISYSMILSAQTADSSGQEKERLIQPLNDGPGEMPFLNDKEEALFRYFAIFRLGNVIATDCLQKTKDAHHSDNDEASSLHQVRNTNCILILIILAFFNGYFFQRLLFPLFRE